MRARNLKPGFFKNEELLALPFECRLLFAGLWCMADREGRLEDRPLRIKIELFPMDDVDVDALLDQLQERKMIHRYEVEEARYIAIPNFTKHQNPHVKEAPSTIPAPGEHSANTIRAGLNPSSLIPESPLLKEGDPPPVENPKEAKMLAALAAIPGYPVDPKKDLELLREPHDPRVDTLAQIRKWRDYHEDEWRDWKKKKPPNYRLSLRNWLEKADVFCLKDNGPIPQAHGECQLAREGPVPGEPEVPLSAMPDEVRKSIERMKAGVG